MVMKEHVTQFMFNVFLIVCVRSFGYMSSISSLEPRKALKDLKKITFEK